MSFTLYPPAAAQGEGYTPQQPYPHGYMFPGNLGAFTEGMGPSDASFAQWEGQHVPMEGQHVSQQYTGGQQQYMGQQEQQYHVRNGSGHLMHPEHPDGSSGGAGGYTSGLASSGGLGGSMGFVLPEGAPYTPQAQYPPSPAYLLPAHSLHGSGHILAPMYSIHEAAVLDALQQPPLPMSDACEGQVSGWGDAGGGGGSTGGGGAGIDDMEGGGGGFGTPFEPPTYDQPPYDPMGGVGAGPPAMFGMDMGAEGGPSVDMMAGGLGPPLDAAGLPAPAPPPVNEQDALEMRCVTLLVSSQC
jgi:hypothetical protein